MNNFNIKQIALSGQCFRWKEINENTFSCVSQDKYIEVTGHEGAYSFSCSDEDYKTYWAHYFDEETDYNYVAELIRASCDSHLIEAYNLGSGIRILNQDLWEIIVSFLISQNNNISRIKNSIEKICDKAALPVAGHENVYRFPRAFEVDEDFFCDSSLGLGYRDVYLKEIYSFVKANPEWLESLSKLSYQDARNELLKRKGIGPKVADCISLFGLHHIDAFPIDTHVKQLLSKYYPSGFNHEYFKGYGGIIQQYLFYYEIK